MRELIKASRKNGALLTAVAVVAVVIVATTNLGTYERILEQKEAMRTKALLEIVSTASLGEDLQQRSITVLSPLLGYETPKVAYKLERGGRVLAVALTAIAPDGYSGNIELLIGVSPQMSIYGVRTVSHQETPGLGDKVDVRKSDWIKSFNGTKLGQPPPAQWLVKRDGGYFDQFTGATITPRAVIKAVRNALEYVEQNRAILFSNSEI